MTVLLALVPLIAGVGLALGGGRLAGSLSGRAATLTLTAAGLVTALATGLVLCAFAYVALARWGPIARAGHWSVTAVAARDPLPLGWSIGCGVLAVCLLVCALRSALVNLRGFARSASHCRRLGSVDLVVSDDPAPTAYALAGLPGRAVVSRSMLRGLSPEERRALLAHEAAHVRNHHWAFVALTEVAAAANPLLRPLRRTVRLSVERWADDAAAQAVGDRRVVATTLARASLAARAVAVPVGALGVSGDVRARLASLLDEPPSVPHRRLIGALVVGASCLVAGCALLVGVQSHDVIEWAETVRGLSRS